jgi:hypothetical protein
MQRRRGFARLLPLTVLTGLAAGTVALLACERPEPRPPRPASLTYCFGAVPDDGGCSDTSARWPSCDIVDSDGGRWCLSEIPAQMVVGIHVGGAEWFGVNLNGATLLRCDFRAADLRCADMQQAHLWDCDFSGADLTDANLTDATFDVFTLWPAGFHPQAHGAHRWKQ